MAVTITFTLTPEEEAAFTAEWTTNTQRDGGDSPSVNAWVLDKIRHRVLKLAVEKFIETKTSQMRQRYVSAAPADQEAVDAILNSKR